MSVYGSTAGTELEDIIRKSEEGEANGAIIYQALALMAREQGYAEAAQVFSEIASMESHHSGFYAAMNARYPKDFWSLVDNIRQAEENADSRMPETIAKVRALGTKEALDAAEGMELIRSQERYHGEILKQLIERHKREERKDEASLTVNTACEASKAETTEENTGEQQKTGSDDSEVKVYVCRICGYEHVGSLDEEPDDYVCPLCHKGKEYFVEKE
ncbi:Rubrerythrin [Succinivibrio dextrinosolvens]|uniref:ferritin family protein n=1 Tax=Succinivibrio dextrinosolvens TaxID=83771 RepID=UPI0008EA49FF|nr:ferritin family protein [Succinivibrio dextrinosolvens]SFS49945.1 Rubrerythrin [Succinivibrio dextrinosolvens]